MDKGCFTRVLHQEIPVKQPFYIYSYPLACPLSNSKFYKSFRKGPGPGSETGLYCKTYWCIMLIRSSVHAE